MVNQLKHHAPYRVGLWVVIMIVFVIGGWRLLILARQPAHILAIATEIGSIAQSKEGQFLKELVPNNNGTALVFYQETETGIGTYFCNVSDNRCKLLFEQKEKGFSYPFGILGWAPGDRLFACFVPSSPDTVQSSKGIILYDGTSGQRLVKMPGDSFREYSLFVWLSAHSFVYSSYNQTLILFNQNPDGTWIQRPAIRLRNFFSKNVADGDMKNLTATTAPANPIVSLPHPGIEYR